MSSSIPTIRSYVSLPLSASPSEVNAAFRDIAPFDAQASKALAQLVLDDLKATLVDKTVSRLSKQGAIETALPKLKDLGKTPAVATILASPSNLRCLLGIAAAPDIENLKENNALRCIANTCLLIESARATFIVSDVNGGNICLDLLQKSSSLEIIYLTSRILFLCTASSESAQFIEWMVENKRPNTPGSGTAVDIIGTKMDELVRCIAAGNSAASVTPEDAMTDLLKLIFNICVHYPKLVDGEIQTAEVAASAGDQKVMGDCWSPRLDGLLPPLLRAFHALPPSSPHPLVPPMSHIIHSLITIPVSSFTRTMWFGPQPSVPQSRTASCDSASSSTSSSPKQEINVPISIKEPKPKAFDRALSALAASKRSWSRLSISRSSTPAVPDTAIRVCELLDATLASFFQGDSDPDDINIRDRFRTHWSMKDSSMSDTVSPLVLLLTRFCLGDEDAKLRIRSWFVPDNLDRTKPLEGRDDVLGRCLRLLPSVYHSRLGRCIGEMFFAMYDSTAMNLTALGYGNFAGFLFSKGLASGPPPASSSGGRLTTASGQAIDPITGTIAKEREPDNSMTDEEKEREAEKLFILFDRLERTGSLPSGQNPIRKAIQRGGGGG